MYKKKMTNHYIEFAARWREKLLPDQVKIGKQLSKEKSKALAGVNSGKERLVNGSYKSLTNVSSKIDQVANSSKAAKSQLGISKFDDPLLKSNKNLRSYLENRKVKQGTSSPVLNKPYQAPKTIKRPTRPDAGLYKKIKDNPKRLAESIAKQPQIPKKVPTPRTKLPPNPSAPRSPLPKVGLSGFPKKNLLQKVGSLVKRHRGAGLAVGLGVGVGTLSHALSKRKNSKNNR